MKTSLYLLLTAAILIAGCSRHSDNNPVSQSNTGGNVLLKIDRQNAPQGVTFVSAKLTRDGFDPLTASLNLISDTSAEFTFQNISAGTWHLRVDARDSAEIILYSGETDVNVQSNMITQVNLRLDPTGNGTGGIQIFVSWGTTVQNTLWKKQTVNVTCDFRGVYFLNENRGWAIGNNGIVVSTTNGGVNWTSQTLGSGITLNAITFSDSLTGWIVGSNERIYRSGDGGQTWTLARSASGSTINFRDVAFLFGSRGVISGDAGIILVTTNGGLSWNTKNLPYVDFFDATFQDENVIVAVGTSGLVYRSLDMGNSWTLSANSGSPVWMQAVQFPGRSLIGYSAGGLGVVIKSYNGGQSWTQLSSGTSEHLEDLYFFDENNGRIVGNNGLIRKTTNGGTTWTTEPTGTHAWLNGIYFPNSSKGWAVGQQSTILKYSN